MAAVVIAWLFIAQKMKKSWMENFIFCAVYVADRWKLCIELIYTRDNSQPLRYLKNLRSQRNDFAKAACGFNDKVLITEGNGFEPSHSPNP